MKSSVLSSGIFCTADCVDSVSKVERPGMDKAVINATGEVLRTDGGVIVFHLKTCSDRSES